MHTFQDKITSHILFLLIFSYTNESPFGLAFRLISASERSATMQFAIENLQFSPVLLDSYNSEG